MALAAHIGNRSQPWRSSAMIAVTIIAGGSRNVLTIIERLRVHAGFVLLELIGGNLVWFHVIGAAVALAACLGNIDRIDPG